MIKKLLSRWLGRNKKTSVDTTKPVFDYAALLDSLGNNHEIAKKFLEGFISEADSIVADIDKAVNQHDFAQLKLSAHGLKSLARVLFSSQLIAVCEQLEQAALDKNADSASIHMGDLEHLVHTLEGQIDHTLHEHNS